MSNEKPEKTNDLPEWIKHEMERWEPLTDDEKERFDHLKGAFASAIRRAGRFGQPAPPCILDAVFTLGGRLLEWGETLLPSEPVQPAAVSLARSVGGIGAVSQSKDSEFKSVAKQIGDYCIVCSIRGGRPALEVSVDVVHSTYKVVVRPISVTVFDEEGRTVMPPTSINRTDEFAVFPGPEAGIYVFSLRWDALEGRISVEFVPEAE